MSSCADCDHRDDPEGYCYMFKDKPSVVEEWGHCAQHQDVPKLPHDAAMALIPLLVAEAMEEK